MGQPKTPGLIKRGGLWHIDEFIRGRRVCESTGTSDKRQAEEILAQRVNQIREATLFGVRAEHTVRAAATRFLIDNKHRRAVCSDAIQLKTLDPFIGSLPLYKVDIGCFQKFIESRRKDAVTTKSINHARAVVRRIVNLASPYPINFDEQARLFRELPVHLARMARFKFNTGCREAEVCKLRWEWEVTVPELETSVFIIPNAYVKNGEDRLVVLNRVARSVIDEVRGEHPEFVFTYQAHAPAPLVEITTPTSQRAR